MTILKGFRPQQGLSIMNVLNELDMCDTYMIRFPSPTGVKYYE